MKVPTTCGADSPGAEGSTGLDGTSAGLLQGALLAWYRSHARPLRIRGTRDPWAVLVAEVMAQQTQISRVDEAWAAFLERFPTPRALAAAPPAEVLRAWAGLGYNRRAISLQRAARVIETEHRGRVPDDVAALERLPGVGPYTSRAVAALAFGRRVAAVDTNVRRVIGRWLGRMPGRGELQVLADGLVAPEDPATWTHATMDLGATICRAARPDCASCPVRVWCASADRRGEVRHALTRAAPGAARAARATRARRPGLPGPAAVPFERTTRWLRGRIVAQLRDLPDGAWTQLPGTIGEHGPGQVAAAVMALRRDGLLEQHADGSVRLPSEAP
jgi:A/G-specific adenine glycosylase